MSPGISNGEAAYRKSRKGFISLHILSIYHTLCDSICCLPGSSIYARIARIRYDLRSLVYYIAPKEHIMPPGISSSEAAYRKSRKGFISLYILSIYHTLCDSIYCLAGSSIYARFARIRYDLRSLVYYIAPKEHIVPPVYRAAKPYIENPVRDLYRHNHFDISHPVRFDMLPCRQLDLCSLCSHSI